MKHNYAVVNSRVSGFSFGSTEYDIPVWRFFPTPPPKKDAVTPLTTGGIVGALAQQQPPPETTTSTMCSRWLLGWQTKQTKMQ